MYTFLPPLIDSIDILEAMNIYSGRGLFNVWKIN